jgi:hypothetical protein
VITLQNLFEIKLEGIAVGNRVLGSLNPTGLRPTFLHKFEMHGEQIPAHLSPNGAHGMGDARRVTPK